MPNRALIWARKLARTTPQPPCDRLKYSQILKIASERDLAESDDANIPLEIVMC
jgi:hypothetical protein